VGAPGQRRLARRRAYTLTLTGTNSAGIASYGGNLAVMPISAVPEPASFALMLAGASVVLFLARRRRD
jgi:hypothetical protein